MIPAGLTTEALRDVAQSNGVCIRPVVHQVLDTMTGQVRTVSLPCRATLASKCPSCAQRNRVLRMQHFREGWHLETEPEKAARAEEPDVVEAQSEPARRRTRSTRRRQDAPNLPRLPLDARTVGTTFTTASGRTYRPSMFITLTLPSYGPVRADGTPVSPSTYDYRRAALEALHFPKVIDRFWQNLRRATGYQVQYFAAVEAQRRLAPHLHAAVRGAIPRVLIRQVAAATYHQVWWPSCLHVVHGQDDLPQWREGVGYVDGADRPLPTWDEALDELDADHDARPCHTLRLGKQLDIQGIVAGEEDADRRVGYLTKYLAKSFVDAWGATHEQSARQRRHVDRLRREVRWLPCSPRCANWLRYGVQPDDARPGLIPGKCSSKAHDSDHLGCGGRRVLVSRKWTGKTLTDHRSDRAEVVRQTLLAAGMATEEVDRLSTSVRGPDGRRRYAWTMWNAAEATVPVYRQVLTRSISERLRWKQDYEAAKARASPMTKPSPSSRQPAPFRGGQVGQG